VLAAGVVLAIALSLYALRQQRQLARRLPRRPPAEPTATAPSALQHVGVVRFNPYHDTGGDYSFAVALLDAAGAGVVITGLYHRDRCRVYAKPVRAWESSYTLTDEEREAIEGARVDKARDQP
jgi:hypothetical protein